MKNFAQFLRDSKGWGVASEFAGLVLYAVGLWEHGHDKSVPGFVFMAISVPLFWFGAYCAWSHKNGQLQKEITKHNVPDIRVTIDEVHVEAASNGAHVFLSVALHNQSNQTSMVQSYRLGVAIGSGRYDSEEIASCEGWMIVRFSNTVPFLLSQPPEPLCDLQTDVTTGSLQRGIPKHGWLHFFVRNLPAWPIEVVTEGDSGFGRYVTKGLRAVDLTVLDAFGLPHCGSAEAPWKVSGQISYRPDLDNFLGRSDATPPIA